MEAPSHGRRDGGVPAVDHGNSERRPPKLLRRDTPAGHHQASGQVRFRAPTTGWIALAEYCPSTFSRLSRLLLPARASERFPKTLIGPRSMASLMLPSPQEIRMVAT
jgi:hypothetical protein